MEGIFLRQHLGGEANKPFDVLAEGLVAAQSRSDKMAIELFMVVL
jgi:hypothetical protein